MITLSAILNSPLANAFIFTHGSVIDLTLQLLKRIPIPAFTQDQKIKLRNLVINYRSAIRSEAVLKGEADQANLERMLMEIDAAVLDGYRMPPRIERSLLDFFNGHDRATIHRFGRYVPEGCEFYFSLSRFLKPHFGAVTAKDLLRRIGE